MGCEESQLDSKIQPYVMDTPLEGHGASSNLFKLLKSSRFRQAETIGNCLFKEGKISEAIKVYQAIIESGYVFAGEIEGLGFDDHAIARYERTVYRWYASSRKTGKFKENPYDALSLCYYLTNNKPLQLQEGLIWYQNQISNRTTHELYMGYANILYNLRRYNEAQATYQKIIHFQPDFVNAYVAIMMISQYRLVDRHKSDKYCKIILEMDADNMYARFVAARNSNKNEKMTNLAITANNFPEYVRITHQLGLECQKMERYKEAIEWHERSIVIYSEYYEGYISIGNDFQALDNYHYALSWQFKACELSQENKAVHGKICELTGLLNLSDQQILREMFKYNILDKFTFLYQMGLAYYDRAMYEESIKWYNYALKVEKSHEVLRAIAASENKIVFLKDMKTVGFKDSKEAVSFTHR